MADSPIFAKTDDFLVWLIPQTLKFPKSQRFVLAKVRPNREVLVEADVELENVRLHLMAAQSVASHLKKLARDGRVREVPVPDAPSRWEPV
jgi:hypothetical protein